MKSGANSDDVLALEIYLAEMRYVAAKGEVRRGNITPAVTNLVKTTLLELRHLKRNARRRIKRRLNLLKS